MPRQIPLSAQVRQPWPVSEARSDGSGLFCRFGLMTDDYTPKPAFHVYRDLIARY
jgi:hypothetical protein